MVNAPPPQHPHQQHPHQQHPHQRSLWGRLLRRTPPKAEHLPPPLVRPPIARALTTTDALWTLDRQGGRVYVPLAVVGQSGTWAGREWQHCGDRDGVLLVAWHARDNPMALQHPYALADGQVRVIEGGQAQ